MSKADKLKEVIRQIVRELLQSELEEASTSAATPGYQTPMAFSGGRKKDKKKKKDIANAAGYDIVKEGRYHDYRNDEYLHQNKRLVVL